MRYSKCAILVFLLFSFLTGFSQTVFVTSTADAGAGTLREALKNIPTVRTTPYIINFNLPGDMSNETNRTIRLRSQLPNVPSNVTIDGTTQTGPALGASGAKIIIEPEDPSMTSLFTSCLTIANVNTTDVQTSDVEIYGLYIKDFARITNLQNTSIQASGIIIDARAKNIKIGAPGKGNVISGNQYGISLRSVSNYYLTTPITDISIRSNFIGLHYDGLTAKTNFNGINAIDFRDGSLTIGGDNPGDGNVISANKINIDLRGSSYGSTRFAINVVNNKIGTDRTGTIDFHGIPLFAVPSAVEISGLKVDAANTNLYVRDNVISGNRTAGLSIANADFIVTGNSIGTGVQGSEVLGNGIGVKIESGAVGFIGGDTDAKANKIANNEFGIESLSAKPITITRNSMYCNTSSGIGKTQNIAQPYVQILITRSGFLSGKATPNSTIELFYTENCKGLCEGRQYFATVPTGSDGRWNYSGTISGKVTATATVLNLTTSPFSTAEVLDNEILNEPVTCNGNGSIKVPEPREGITFQWYKVLGDGTKVDLGTAQEILDLREGFYELITNDGCREIKKVPLLEIKDQKLTDLIVSWPAEQCGQTSFTFSATVQRGKGVKTFKWVDQAGNIIRTGTPVTMPAGTYKLIVTDEAGCSVSEQGREIKERPIPRIVNSVPPSPAKCGFADGAITGITIGGTPTGTLTYRWNVYNPSVPPYIGAIVGGNQLDLTGVEGGMYILTVMDQGNCTPVTQIYTIPIIKSVNISLAQTTRATCNKSNGSIFGVTITEANYIQWFSPAGVILEEGTYSPGQSLLLKDLAPGTYTLKARNTITGCSDSRDFRVDQTLPTIYNLSERIVDATCGLNNGRITLTYTTAEPRRFEWRDDMGTVLPTGTVKDLNGVAPGTYRYFTYDDNNCILEFGPFVVHKIDELAIIPGSGMVTNDGCSLSRGAVKGVRFSGGVQPYRFTWENEAGERVYSGATPDLLGVPAGKYRMILEDATSCGHKESADYYTVENPSFPISTPVANDLRVCYATEIMIKVLAPEEGTYQLYREETNATPIMESTNGIFIFKVNKTGDYKIRKKLGSCYSKFAPLHIEVTNDNLEIKNTMTPNGDGMNDYWMITGLPDHADINIKVYTRSGQLVYESVGPYNKPFDGKFRGVDLPAGAYYYKIDLRADCKPIAGSITLLR
ncbi:MAG: gliding motility-associated C-terminal domain-containing protein [Candidatus Pedobacter colombiensis]|uniref:Gliding motility-associated C-terminal domain-containing protein n=1 Tax=Candidatus Pedobacter colombiensis TaxID=3121371 RepID=A0AAJ6B6U4_9SPHI|nr:gliding motility-associated C-terminal domain-containing protein [Pedobacter sp.]WEK18841.1 MAG: gliding motility-associated C-terminal domain-containing protein [Pedobacter sp.]